VNETMGAIIEMFRGSAESKQPPGFSCSLKTWELLWELGQTFGWRPKGATYVAPAGRKISTPILRNYDPGAALDRKWVDAGDALDWAASLSVARQSPHLEAMLDAHCAAADGLDGCERDQLPSVIDRFIGFASNGAFEFAVADPDSAQPTEDVRSARQPSASPRKGDS
jgi:hypothetical protein